MDNLTLNIQSFLYKVKKIQLFKEAINYFFCLLKHIFIRFTQINSS